MIKRMSQVIVLCGVGLLCHTVSAASLDGTLGTSIYQALPYAFANGDFARGFVRLNDGFSVPAGGIVYLNLLESVAGQINLNTTGHISLEGDLAFASGASIVAGGSIDGRGNAVFLSDNLTLPAGTSLTFTSTTIVDGCGHELVLANGTPGAVLVINGLPGTTVKLRNMVLRGVQDYSGTTPAIQFGPNPNQTLELENVIIDLSGDITFLGGNLSICGDVMVVGAYTSVEDGLMTIDGYSFIYQAANDCTINSNATLGFDLYTTFNYQPSDASATHLVFADGTARLFLNGATLFTPQTIGLLLTKGHMVVDNYCTLESDYPISSGVPVVYDGKLIQMGDGTNPNEFTVTILAGALLNIYDAMLKNCNRS